jgi:stress response protein YsnF
MALHKIKDFYSDYRDQFRNHDLLSFGLYAGVEHKKIGSIDDLLVDDEGQFRYLIANTGAWIFGKKVLIPIGQTQIDYTQRQIYAEGLSREQVENLPEYSPNQALDYDYEEQVRSVYRPIAPVLNAPLNATGRLSERPIEPDLDVSALDDSRDGSQPAYRYDPDPDLYDIDKHDQTLRLCEERLIAGKTRQKIEDVAISREIEAEPQYVSMPIEKIVL